MVPLLRRMITNFVTGKVYWWDCEVARLTDHLKRFTKRWPFGKIWHLLSFKLCLSFNQNFPCIQNYVKFNKALCFSPKYFSPVKRKSNNWCIVFLNTHFPHLSCSIISEANWSVVTCYWYLVSTELQPLPLIKQNKSKHANQF